jgi:hypothetical protein
MATKKKRTTPAAKKPAKKTAAPLSRTKVRIRINAVVSGAFGHAGLPSFNMHSAIVAGLEDAGYKLEELQSVMHPGARLQISIAR